MTLTRRPILKYTMIALLALGVLAMVAPFIPAPFLRGPAEAALARGVDRPVSIDGQIHFTLFPSGPVPGPGFTLEQVTIHEDPRVGIEPFAYIPELGAGIRLLSLLSGRLDIDSLNLVSAEFETASLNLAKTEQGNWNFQYLLNSLREQQQLQHSPLPSLRMRGGRVNFKFGDTKSVFFFRDADFDVSPTLAGGLDLTFGGDPSRSDHTSQDFGRFFLRGSAAASGQLDLSVELEKSSLEETLRLMDPQGFGVHGVLAMKGRIHGAPDALAVTGQLQIGDVHRWDLLPEPGQNWTLPYSGTLDFRNERLDLASTQPTSGFSWQFHARDYLSKPQWSANAAFTAVPLVPLLQIARHMGSTLPENLTADGSISGDASYDQTAGLTGNLRLGSASLKLPDSDPIQANETALAIQNGVIRLAPTRIAFSPTETAQVEGSVALASPHTLDLRITTRGLDIGALRSFGFPPIPLMGDTPQGSWRGWLRLQNDEWTGAVNLRQATLTLDGLAQPISVDDAALSLASNRVTIASIVGSVGTGDSAIDFTGSYAERHKGPPRFSVLLAEVNAADLEHVLSPTIARAGPGFFQRTLRLSSAAPPAWLKTRHAEGVIEIASAKAGDWQAHDLRALIGWDGSTIHFTNLTASVDPADFEGSLDIDLAQPTAKYHLSGEFTGVTWRGGRVNLNGAVDAEGSGAQLLESVSAEGTVNGRTIAFAPGANFRTLRAAFKLQPVSQGPRWKFSDVQVTQGFASFSGAGSSQEDGRVLLDLARGEQSVRYTGSSIFAAPSSK